MAAIDQLAEYDAIIVGTPTRLGRMSFQLACFLDQAGGLWARGALNGTIGGAFTSTATQHGGQETTPFSVISNLLLFGMIVVGLPYSHQGQMTISEIVGGSPYGATTVAGSSGERQPTLTELDGARQQGQLNAALSNKLFDDWPLGTTSRSSWAYGRGRARYGVPRPTAMSGCGAASLVADSW